MILESSIHKPNDCALLIGIPVKLEEYDDCKSGNAQSDFLSRCCRTRMKFCNEVFFPVNDNLQKIVKYKCQTFFKISDVDIKLAFEKSVVIIFSHWDNNCIEMNGVMLDDLAFCKLIPEDFNGIIDICACQPEDHLVVSVKNRVPKATVKCTLTKVTPAIWIEIIYLTLYLLHKHKLHYRDASKLVLQQILKKYNEKQN